MRCGFHLAGLPHHEPAVIAGPLYAMGYRTVAIRCSAAWMSQDEQAVARLLATLNCFQSQGLELVLDADGLFVSNPWDASSPQLAKASENPAREMMLLRLTDLAATAGCQLLTFSVGQGDPDEDIESVLKRIGESIFRLAER